MTFHLPAMPLTQALFRLSEQAGIQIVFDQTLAEGLSTDAVEGNYSVASALDTLLLGTGIAWQTVGPGTITLVPAPEHILQSVRVAGVRPDQRSLAQWEATLLSRIERVKRYPPDALRTGQEGIVYLRVTIERSGGVSALSIVRSDASEQLETTALALIRRAAPLPPLPPDIVGDNYTVVLPIDFAIHRRR